MSRPEVVAGSRSPSRAGSPGLHHELLDHASGLYASTLATSGRRLGAWPIAARSGSATSSIPQTGKPGPNRLVVGSADLTTHGVIVGMTGSGKTGLGIVLLEEALLAGIPALILDPKGDMGNLALAFPDLAPASFRPWVERV